MTLPLLSIKREKITAYLLDMNSIDGASKAKFFIARGFSIDKLGVFVSALGNHAASHWPGREMKTDYGTKRIIVGPMQCPDGTTPNIRTVWMLSPDETNATLITAYPADE